MAYVETYMERNLKLLEKPLRLGLLLPSSNTAMEEELAQMIPGNDVTVHASRVRLSDVTPEALVEMENNSEEAALELADAGVDIIEYTCSSKIGYEHEKEFAARLEKLTNVRAVPYTEGVVEGLRALGAQRIAVATPYIREVDELETDVDVEVLLKVTCRKGWGGWAARLREKEAEEVLGGGMSGVTANQLELVAAAQILTAVPRDSSLLVRGGSDYLRKGASVWMSAWKTRGWRTKDGGEIKNTELWRRLDRLLAGREVH